MSGKPLDPSQDEDTKAILTRRALLIRASLAGAGLVVGTGAGCEQSQVCLSGKVLLPPDAGVCLGDVQVCLTQDVQDGPEVCLKDVHPGDLDVPDVIEPDLQACLSPPLDAIEQPDVPSVCLSDVPEAPDGPQICLSPLEPDTEQG